MSIKRAILLILVVMPAFSSTGEAQIINAAKTTQTKETPTKQEAAKQEAAKQEAAKAVPAQPKRVEDCGCEAANLPDVVAVVNDVKLNLSDIDEPIKPQLNELRNRVIEARKHEVDLQINSRLLEAEAKKLGMSPQDLIEKEIISKVKEPTEAEAEAFYDQNKERIKGRFDEVKGQIIQFLTNRKQSEEAKKYAERLRSAADVKVLVESVTPPETEADRARVFATVNGDPITSGDVEDSLKPLTFGVQQGIYDLRQKQMEMRINDLLLNQEAQKKKITTRALLEAEVTSKTEKVTEEDARDFYEKNKERIEGEYAQIKDRIIEYLTRTRQREAEVRLSAQLRSEATLKVFLAAPAPPVFQIATDDQPSKGRIDAPVTIVEFTDYECPTCAKTQPIIERLAKEYGDRVRVVVRDFPLQKHAEALKAAEAAEGAREQDKYWEYVALLFENQSALTLEKLKEYATQVGLDRKRFDEALSSGKFSDKVTRDIEDGQKLGINSTPTIFVNGRPILDKTYESLKTAIEAAFKDSQKKSAEAGAQL